MRNLLLIISLFLIHSVFGQLSSAEYSIHNIEVNSKFSDFGTAFFGPNKIVFASSKLDGKILKNKFHRKTEKDEAFPYYDLFEGFLNHTGEINYVKRLMNDFVTKYNESNVSFTPDLKHVYFTQNKIINGKYTVKDKSGWVPLQIYRADVTTSGEWTNIISVSFNNSNYNFANPSVSEDGKILFFVSDMSGTYGQSDIFWVTILKDGTYGEPQNIGTHVNSDARETFPYVDGNILYFSSDKKGTKGGLDVFMVPLDDPYAVPINLGSPINSVYDDFCFIIDRSQKKGFFSSNRPKGKGDDDIYSFIQKTKIQECKQIVQGEIRDKETNEVIPGAIVSMYSHDNILLAIYPVKGDGKFTFDLACRGNYRVEANQIGYSKTFKQIDFTPTTLTQTVILYLEKDAVKPKEEIVIAEKPKPVIQKPVKKQPQTIYKNNKELLDLPPIYFELDLHYITKEAMETLGKAVQILNDFPDIKIEVGSYTDCRASDSYNLLLSDLRAKEVVSFILEHGISRNRIFGRGYGESKPVNQCIDGVKCTESEHLQNRRTEFIIIQK